MRKAFTVLELLVVTSILVLLAALISPVLAEAKESAKVASSVARLKQLNIAVRLYSGDWGEEGKRLSTEAVHDNYLGLGKAMFVSPCGIKTNEQGQRYDTSYTYLADPYLPASYFSRHGDNAVQFSDPDCNDEGVYWSITALKRVLFVTDGGQVVNKKTRGDVTSVRFWMSVTEPTNE